MLSVVLAGLMVVAAAQLGPVWGKLLHEREAAREMAEFESLESYRQSAKFDEWLARDEAGLQWTVRALASSRSGVSHGAEEALLRETDHWRIRPRAEVAPRMLAIARELTEVAQRVPASRRPFIRRLMQRFAESASAEVVASRELISACDQILAQLPPPTPEELLLAERDREQAAEALRVARSLQVPVVPADPVLQPELDRDPRELLPPDDLPPAEKSDVDDQGRQPAKKVPRRFFAPRATEMPTTPVTAPEIIPLLPPGDSTVKKSVSEWVGELADLEVMRLLHHGDYGVRYTAERELDRRGYSREHLPLAKQLVHPDPRERRKLAEQLPRLANIDPRPWLMQLSADDDATVRRTAEGILQASRPGKETQSRGSPTR